VIRGARAEVSLSLFASDIDDYILIESNYAKGMRRATVVDNVAARSWGGEADATLRFGEHWRATGTLAYTRGQNRSAGTPLAQMPPLEARIAVERVGTVWSAGALLRAVAAQDRVVVNQGNIVGQDIGPSAGFAVLSVNAGWKPRAGWLVSLGVDNLLDRDYAEHLSRAGATLAGFERTTRVNEPGRTAWLKLTAEML
jgi:iron complex outermembrane receptor protein